MNRSPDHAAQDGSKAMQTPAQQSYRMPAEWEPHAATWLTWPRPEGISFPDKFDGVPEVYANLIRVLTGGEKVHINVWDELMERRVRETLTSLNTPLDRVRFHHFPSYEPWCRDHGPIFLVREREGIRERAVTNWGYNAWGGKYPPFDLDNDIPRHVAAWRGLPLFSPDLILEGGSIEVDGEGALLTTTSCLLNPNRNPNRSREEIEEVMRQYLGVWHILWLRDGGLAGDDTDGHIDNLARFLDPRTIAAPLETDPRDPNYEPLRSHWRQLEAMRDPRGQPYRLVPMPMPGVVTHQGQRLPASYMNFYIANQAVVVPTYGHRSDAEAIGTLRKAFPTRDVVGIDSTALIWGLGSFHCITQQEPA